MSTLSPTEALWAHVLRKDKTQSRDLDMPQVPVAPVDRNATSTRILLYDTQARLEQFSSRADAMLKGMQDANHQLKTVGMLFEKDRDTLTNDIIDLGRLFPSHMHACVHLVVSQSKPERSTECCWTACSGTTVLGISRETRTSHGRSQPTFGRSANGTLWHRGYPFLTILLVQPDALSST